MADPDPPTPPAPAPAPPVVDPPEPKPDDVAAMAAALKKANDEAKTYRLEAAKAKELQTELDALKASSMTDTEKAIKQARADAAAETDKKWRDRFLSAEVRAAAAGKVVDPDLVVRLIDTDALKWKGDELDSASLTAAIDELVKARPYLAPSTGKAPPDVPTGPRGTKTPISRDQLKTMSPAEVNEARRKGELDHLMTG